MSVVTKLIFYIIPIVVLVLLVVFFYTDAGAFEKVKKSASKVESYVPDISVGEKEIAAERPSLPENQQEAIMAFKEALLRTKTSSHVNCFTKFRGFPPFGEDGAGFVISYIPTADLTSVRVTGVKQTFTELSFEVPGMRPCVVGGGMQYTDGFYKNYLHPSLTAEDSFNPIYNDVSEIRIWWDSGGLFERAAIRIQYDDSGFHDFKGHRWLYKPDENHICFFPTDSSTTAVGLRDYFFTDFSTDPLPESLQYKVQNSLLKQC